MLAPIPPNESARLAALYDYNVLDTLPESEFDDLTALAAEIVGTPIALISFIDKDRQWFKSRRGMELTETPRDIAFCAHAINGSDVFVVNDATKDDRFKDNPMVTSESHIRFYAGMPLMTPDGLSIGAICTKDRVPRSLSDGQRKALEILARQVIAQLELRRLLRDHNARNAALGALQELSNLLHSCVTLEEAGKIISRGLRHLMPGDSGSVFLINSSHHTLETLTEWGECIDFQTSFAREACWALRRGRTHTISGGADEVDCPHLRSVKLRASICVPLMAQGEILGALSVVPRKHIGRQEQRLKEDFWLVETVAGIVAVALAGLRMREALHESSIRDSLTGLFNRRYMEVTIERELHRALRAKIPLSLVVLDLDHFKRLNDTHGHDAGDTVLRAFGKVLREAFREDDLVCRSGGEEFVVIMPGAQAINATRRVDDLRAKVNRLQIPFGAGVTLTFSFSAGVATFPQHGDKPPDLLHVADAALYEAKRKGRNRVVAAGESQEAAPTIQTTAQHAAGSG